jgi:hypothetical protein
MPKRLAQNVGPKAMVTLPPSASALNTLATGPFLGRSSEHDAVGVARIPNVLGQAHLQGAVSCVKGGSGGLLSMVDPLDEGVYEECRQGT